MKNNIFIAIYILFTLVLGIFINSLIFEKWSVTYQVPVTISFKTPIVIKERIKEATPEVKILNPVPDDISPAPKKQVYDLDKIVKSVSMLESNDGKATSGHGVYCRNLGKTNKYGYGVYTGFCFDNEEVAYETIFNWYDKRLNKEGLALSEAACFYNLGKNADGSYIQSCKYASDLISLL